MYKFGLKLWSTNLNYIDEAKRLYDDEVYNYIELYTVPNSYNEYINYWKKLQIPFIIHGPHYSHGLNFSDRNKREGNIKLAEESIRFCDDLKSDILIFHPGVNGSIDETIDQINFINDKRIVIENKPYYGLNNEICIGHSPEEIQRIMHNVRVGFCLDIGHTICSANAKKINQIEYIKEFIELNPKIFHLTDGNYNGIKDMHEHYGEGTFPIKDIMKLIENDSMITNETKKNSDENLNDFVEDIKYFNTLIQ